MTVALLADQARMYDLLVLPPHCWGCLMKSQDLKVPPGKKK